MPTPDLSCGAGGDAMAVGDGLVEEKRHELYASGVWKWDKD